MSSALSQFTLRVMVIDDNADHTLLIRNALRDLGNEHGIETMSDGEQALTALHAARQYPDLILLDINMPGYSGFDVLAQLRQHERLRLIPVVMLTSSETQADIARAYELGASGYITKPSHYQDLRAVLGNTMLYWSVMQRYDIPKREAGEPS